MARNSSLVSLFIFIIFTLVACGEDPPPRATPSSNGGGDDYQCTSVLTDDDLCKRASFKCGDHLLEDECKEMRQVNCGDEDQVCEEFETCGGAGEEGLCGCTPGTDEELCEDAEFECGTHEFIDGCGEPREVNCGDRAQVCGEFETCGDQAPGRCSCTPESDEELCEDAEFECGTHTLTDSCGEEREVNCGGEAQACGENQTCGGGGEEGVCGCTAQSDEELCQQASYECGELITIDSCGVERVVESCGDETTVCERFQTCGGGGTEGRCGCTSESDEVLCQNARFECGPLETTDSCGITREIQTCGLESEVCGPYETCGGAGETGICGCTPTSCEEEGILCGELADGCGGTLYCNAFCSVNISVGDQHGCAVGSDRIKCWGRNNQGQLGDGTTTTRQNPVDVVGIQNAIEVAAGTSHTCAIVYNPSEDAEQVRCWGLNQSGQLGNGETVNSRTPATTPAIYQGAVKVALGERHTCAIIDEDFALDVRDADDNISTRSLQTMRCWGSNSHGQLGDPTLDVGAISALSRPVEFPDHEAYTVLDIALGANHSCALLEGPFDFAAPTDEADLETIVYCWGRNKMGQVQPLQPNYDPEFPPLDAIGHGPGSTDTSYPRAIKQPTLLANPGPGAPRWITAGEDHTCVVDENGDDVYCWGSLHAPPRSGSICTDVTSPMYVAPRGETPATQSLQTRKAPVCPVLPPIGAPDTHPLFTYTIATNGNHNMQDGIISAASSKPTHFQISDSPGLNIPQRQQLKTLDVVSGSNHFCAIIDLPTFTSSNIVCLGANRMGQIGDGTDNNWTRTQVVSRDVHDHPVMAVQLSLGQNVSCGLMDDNNVRCWGSNQHGQIGNSALQQDESFRPFDVRLQVAP